MKTTINGFTLIELMIVVTIIGLLAMIAIPNYQRYAARAKRVEVDRFLGDLYTAEKTYWVEHGSYTDRLSGPDSLGWKPDGAVNYTYGFAGAPGVNFVEGKLKAPGSALGGVAKAAGGGFVAGAAADIDGDGKLDIITINEKHEIKIVQDDLQ